jgi:hypothetical protein
LITHAQNYTTGEIEASLLYFPALIAIHFAQEAHRRALDSKRRIEFNLMVGLCVWW